MYSANRGIWKHLNVSGTTLVVFCALTVSVARPASAQSESVVYNFANPPDAYSPRCNLVVDTAGDLYGTTFSGGANNVGSVFKVTAAGTETVLYSFTSGTDGRNPVAGLFRDPASGNLYGTTVNGGTTGNGTVFVVTPAGGETVLYSFTGGLDGANPYGSVVRVGTTVVGTTFNGGAFGYGTVFKVTAGGQETVLHSFNSAFPTLDGAHPYAGLVVHNGILYGTTTLGGLSNLGTVFSITSSGAEIVLYNFQGGANDGQSPNGNLVFDSSGNIYGTTYGGGLNNAGTVFKVSGTSESVLHHFLRNSADGINPYSSLIFIKGNFYGTTLQGGPINAGTIFRISPSGTEKVLHSFTGGADGYNPYGALVLGKNNILYSTTLVGGTSNLGTVFKLVP